DSVENEGSTFWFTVDLERASEDEIANLCQEDVEGAAEAKDKGLVNRVVGDDQVAAEVAATAARIAAGAPLVNRWHKAFANRVMTGIHTPRPVDAADVRESYAAFDTEDFNTGFRAFLAKTPPVFKGR
ncbi:MAG: enoyl-CoA hydratase-related protein, partial [Thalassobaculaceae bacterium]